MSSVYYLLSEDERRPGTVARVVAQGTAHKAVVILLIGAMSLAATLAPELRA